MDWPIICDVVRTLGASALGALIVAWVHYRLFDKRLRHQVQKEAEMHNRQRIAVLSSFRAEAVFNHHLHDDIFQTPHGSTPIRLNFATHRYTVLVEDAVFLEPETWRLLTAMYISLFKCNAALERHYATFMNAPENFWTEASKAIMTCTKPMREVVKNIDGLIGPQNPSPGKPA